MEGHHFPRDLHTGVSSISRSSSWPRSNAGKGERRPGHAVTKAPLFDVPVVTVCPEATLSLLEPAWVRMEEAKQKRASPAALIALFRKMPLFA